MKDGEKRSEVPGVVWDGSRNRWRAYSAGNRKQRIFLGTKKTREEAERLRLDADRGTFPSQEQKQTALFDKMARIRMRAVWRDVTKSDHLWSSFDHFVASVGDRPKVERRLAPIDASKPLGPDNFSWVEPKYDFMTASGRKSYSKERYASDPLYYRRKELDRKFGISLEKYQGMLEEQGGVCGICCQPETTLRKGKILPLSVDHNHTTGNPRGLLCSACNVGIGLLRESPDLMRKAISYVERWNSIESAPLPDNVVLLRN